MSKTPCGECGEIKFQKVPIRYKKLKKFNPLRDWLEAKEQKKPSQAKTWLELITRTQESVKLVKL